MATLPMIPIDLSPWIRRLRRRVAGGELLAFGDIVLSGMAVPLAADLLVRSMLADPDHYGDLPDWYRDLLETRECWRDLMQEFRGLRQRLGEGPMLTPS